MLAFGGRGTQRDRRGRLSYPRNLFFARGAVVPGHAENDYQRKKNKNVCAHPGVRLWTVTRVNNGPKGPSAGSARFDFEFRERRVTKRAILS
jgi:hypothetical protein